MILIKLPFDLWISGMEISSPHPWSSAHLAILSYPNIHANSNMASVSVGELNIGNFLSKMEKPMIPADQISILVDWLVHLNNTSGALKPLVPALLALLGGLLSFFG